jgi:hypothetical protein
MAVINAGNPAALQSSREFIEDELAKSNLKCENKEA